MPVYSHIRYKHKSGPDVAMDLTQGFFAHALEKQVFANFDTERAKREGARFRTFVRVCCDNYVRNEAQASGAKKRGGSLPHLPIELSEAEQMFSGLSVEASNERIFDRAWMRGLLLSSMDRLRAELEDRSSGLRLSLATAYLFVDEDERPSYAELAERFECKMTDVTNHLHAARIRFRSHILVSLRELTASEEEFRLEARELFGLEADGKT